MMRKRRSESSSSSSKRLPSVVSAGTTVTESSFYSSVATPLLIRLFRLESYRATTGKWNFQPRLNKEHNLSSWQTVLILLCCLLTGILLTLDFLWKSIWCIPVLAFFAVATYSWLILITKCFHSELNRKNQQLRFDYDQLAIESFGIWAGWFVYLMQRWVQVVMLTAVVKRLTDWYDEITEEKNGYFVCWSVVSGFTAMISVGVQDLSNLSVLSAFGVFGALGYFFMVLFSLKYDAAVEPPHIAEENKAVEEDIYTVVLCLANIFSLTMSVGCVIIPAVYFEMSNREEFESVAMLTIGLSCIVLIPCQIVCHVFIPNSTEWVINSRDGGYTVLTLRLVNGFCTLSTILYSLRWEMTNMVSEKLVSASDMRLHITHFLISMVILLATLPPAWFLEDDHQIIQEFMELCGWNCMFFFYALPFLIWYKISEKKWRTQLEEYVACTIPLCSTILSILSVPKVYHILGKWILE